MNWKIVLVFIGGLLMGSVGGGIWAVRALARVNAEMIGEAIDAGRFEAAGITYEIKEVPSDA